MSEYQNLKIFVILMVKNLLEYFTKRIAKNQIKKEFGVKKVLKRKGDKLYVKWKSYDNSFDSWINKKDSINESIFSKSEICKTKCES